MNLHEDYKQLDQLYHQLNQRAEKLYDFILLYNDYIYEERDYGAGAVLKMMEIHTLTHIEDNPGITITALAGHTGKTKGAISQTVKNLVAKGLVERRRMVGNSKTVLLHATDEGIKLSRAHKAYDIADITQTLQDLQRTCSIEEIDSFYKVIDAYIALLKEE